MTARNILIALAALATAATAAAPALAHGRHGHWDRHDRWERHHDNRDAFDHRIDSLRQTIRYNRDVGRLSQNQTWRLEDQLQQIAWQKLEYKRSNGYSHRETWILNNRINDVAAEMRYQAGTPRRW